MAIGSSSLFWTKNPNFELKNADVIKHLRTIQMFFSFYESSYRVLVVCQKLVVKRYPIKR